MAIHKPIVTTSSETSSCCEHSDPAAIACVKVHDKITPPNVGDWIYVPTRMSFDHAWDDIAGGLACVKSVKPVTVNGGTHLIGVEQVDRAFYWNVIVAEQATLRARHGDELAHPDPDFNSYD